MRHVFFTQVTAVALGVGVGCLAGTAPAAAQVATSSTSAASTKYRNCAELNKAFPRGVGKKGAVDKTKGKKVTRFTVNNAAYARNTHLDRDKDGIACEKL